MDVVANEEHRRSLPDISLFYNGSNNSPLSQNVMQKNDKVSSILSQSVMQGSNSSLLPQIVTQESDTIEVVLTEHKQTTTKKKSFQFHELRSHFPTYMIIGFGKTGTKALYEVLKLHPSITGPYQEERFFSVHFDRGLISYLKSIPAPPPDGFTIEKSPDYIVHPLAASRLTESLRLLKLKHSKMKFIIILRNPIDRAMSEYIEWRIIRRMVRGEKLDSFEYMVLGQDGKVQPSVPFLNKSCYAHHIRKWLEWFSPGQMCYVDGDVFIHQPHQEVARLERCLGLAPFFTSENFLYDHIKGFYCFVLKMRKICMDASKGRQHPHIDQEVVGKLRDFFQPWDDELPRLIGRNLSYRAILYS